MSQILDSIFKIVAKIGNILSYQSYNSNNRVENKFYGPVTIIGKQPKELKSKN